MNNANVGLLMMLAVVFFVDDDEIISYGQPDANLTINETSVIMTLSESASFLPFISNSQASA